MTVDTWATEKRDVACAAREIASLGLVAGSSGNVSLRLPAGDGSRDVLAITPTGTPHSTIEGQDIVVVDFDVEPVERDLVPSSETLMHVAIYARRDDVNAVIHSHSVYCSVAAVAGLEIPPLIDEMMVSVGGPVRISEYAFPGSQELADNVCDALGERNAALIRNHGAVGVGRDLREAIDVCALVERIAEVFVHASMLGKMNTLPEEVVEAELAIYRMRRGIRKPN